MLKGSTEPTRGEATPLRTLGSSGGPARCHAAPVLATAQLPALQPYGGRPGGFFQGIQRSHFCPYGKASVRL